MEGTLFQAHFLPPKINVKKIDLFLAFLLLKVHYYYRYSSARKFYDTK